MQTMKELRQHLSPEVLALPEEEQMKYLHQLLQQFRASEAAQATAYEIYCDITDTKLDVAEGRYHYGGEDDGLDMSVAAYERFASLAEEHPQQWETLPEGARQKSEWEYVGGCGGRDADEEHTPKQLRFQVGSRVVCATGEGWLPGTVVGLYYREENWPAQQPDAPYQVQLDGEGAMIFAPQDSPEMIKDVSEEPSNLDDDCKKG